MPAIAGRGITAYCNRGGTTTVMESAKVATVVLEIEEGEPSDQQIADAISGVPLFRGTVRVISSVSIDGGIDTDLEGEKL